MLFFKRILDVRKSAASERRGGSRYAVKTGFPLKTIVNILGRDEQGHLLESRDGQGWDWTGRLLDLSFSGARVQLPPTVLARRGDACHLKLDVQGYELIVPAKVAHIAERRDSFLFGLTLDTDASRTQAAFRQLVELVALGATLKQQRPLRPDDSGYLVEEYAGEAGSRLVIWRHLAGREVAAFEFRLKDCAVRGLAGHESLECYAGADPAAARRPASGAKGEEIQRLYQWVVLNLAPAVPADVRDFLQQRAA
jgi:hypothetical protein